MSSIFYQINNITLEKAYDLFKLEKGISTKCVADLINRSLQHQKVDFILTKVDFILTNYLLLFINCRSDIDSYYNVGLLRCELLLKYSLKALEKYNKI